MMKTFHIEKPDEALSPIIQAKIDNQWKSGLEQLSTQILRDCNEFCKMDQGYLIMSSYIHSRLREGVLIWQTPYAKRQYYAIQTAYKENNPQAQWRWCEAAKQQFGDEWKRQAPLLVTGGN
jgi:hypothetical protein